MVTEIRAAQAKGEVTHHGGDRKSEEIKVADSDLDPVTYSELGVTRQEVAEWSNMADLGPKGIEKVFK
jgi:hypothetical protein